MLLRLEQLLPGGLLLSVGPLLCCPDVLLMLGSQLLLRELRKLVRRIVLRMGWILVTVGSVVSGKLLRERLALLLAVHALLLLLVEVLFGEIRHLRLSLLEIGIRFQDGTTGLLRRILISVPLLLHLILLDLRPYSRQRSTLRHLAVYICSLVSLLTNWKPTLNHRIHEKRRTHYTFFLFGGHLPQYRRGSKSQGSGRSDTFRCVVGTLSSLLHLLLLPEVLLLFLQLLFDESTLQDVLSVHLQFTG